VHIVALYNFVLGIPFTSDSKSKSFIWHSEDFAIRSFEFPLVKVDFEGSS
jgi:hypothetical protein